MPFVGRLRSPYQPTFSQGFQQVGSLISNLMIQKIQQNFREKEATIQRDLQMGLAGFQKEAPTTRTTTTPSGGKRRLPAEAVQPDIEAGGQEYFYKGFKPRMLGSIQGHSLVEVAPGKTIMVDDLFEEVLTCIEKGERVLVTTLTKRMAEDLSEYYSDLGIKVRYLHADISTCRPGTRILCARCRRWVH